MCLNRLHPVDIPIDNVGYQVFSKRGRRLFPLYVLSTYIPEDRRWETSKVFQSIKGNHNWIYMNCSPVYPLGFHIFPRYTDAETYSKEQYPLSYDNLVIFKVIFADVLATGDQRADLKRLPIIVCNYRRLIEEV